MIGPASLLEKHYSRREWEMDYTEGLQPGGEKKDLSNSRMLEPKHGAGAVGLKYEKSEQENPPPSETMTKKESWSTRV